MSTYTLLCFHSYKHVITYSFCGLVDAACNTIPGSWGGGEQGSEMAWEARHRL